MRLNRIITSITAVAAALAAMSLTAEADASSNPVVKIGTPEAEGDSVKVQISYIDDNDEIVAYNLTPRHIGMYGFTGNIEIEGEEEEKTITFTDVEATGGEMYITINGGTAVDADGNLAHSGKSQVFYLSDKESPDTGIGGIGIMGGLAAGAVAAAMLSGKVKRR